MFDSGKEKYNQNEKDKGDDGGRQKKNKEANKEVD